MPSGSARPWPARISCSSPRKPFDFEGTQRKRVADAAASELAGNVDALIIVPNDRVGDVLAPEASVTDASGAVDDVLLHGVQGIIDPDR
jgi:cell division protein FtsZ